MGIAVLSTFEGGYQPITALTACTALADAGEEVNFCDLYVAGTDSINDFADHDIIAISVPLFDSLTPAVSVATQLRTSNPDACLVFFGQYATINATRLVRRYCNYAVVGEWEDSLVQLAKSLGNKSNTHPVGVLGADHLRQGIPVLPQRPRNRIAAPNRALAPSLDKYPQPHLDKLLGEKKLIGAIETTRGCHHKCAYCSVFAAYDGKVLLSQEDIIIRDVTALVDAGMEHLTFVDADFFNAKRFALRVLSRLHEEFPRLTYDLTTRLDHIVECRDQIGAMSKMNVRVITSALEFPSQLVLDQLTKEMALSVMQDAIRLLSNSGIVLNPTFIMFNPWTGLDDLIEFQDFLEDNCLQEAVDPIQFGTRLHLYKGSPLLLNPTIQSLTLHEQEFHYNWEHPDPGVDELYRVSIEAAQDTDGFKRCCLKC